MRIRGKRGRWVRPPDVESSTLQQLPPLSHPDKQFHPPAVAIKSSISFEQDPLIGMGECEDTTEGKNQVAATIRSYQCNPSSETSADTDSSVSSPSSHHGHWLEKDRVLPLKKRRFGQMYLENKEPRTTRTELELKNSNETRTKRKRTEKIWADYVLEVQWIVEKAEGKPRDNSQRCNRKNGKGWRCSFPTFDGHTVCKHHLAEQRKKTKKYPKKKSIPASCKA